MEIRRCFKCMASLPEGVGVCPVCGRSYGNWKTEPFALKPGTILDGKYLVGEMLGQGGFGITYLGFDLLLEQKVAIKEYFPMSTGTVSRDNHSTVIWSSTMMGKSGTERGFDSFLLEARKMAKLGGIPGVVGVKSVFIENETAYIVMDYVEGETLQKKLEREGPMDFETCVTLLRPVMQALGQVHAHGIIHRDISPDNIMVQPDGKLILLDLGAAKELDFRKPDGTLQSSQLVAKHGFSPFEQYTRSGKLGPWTDVYAMSATIYYCCTGKVPPPAVDRIMEDTLICRPNLTKMQFHALSQGMAVQVDDRLPDMAALIQALGTGGNGNIVATAPAGGTSPTVADATEYAGGSQPKIQPYGPTIPSGDNVQQAGTTTFVNLGSNTQEKADLVGWLVCVEGPSRGKDYQIRNQNNYIGRSSSSDICIPEDTSISSDRSANIVYDDITRSFFFGPVMGKNAVRVNGALVVNSAQLQAYDVLQVGVSKLLFVPLCGDRFDWNEK